MEVAQARRAVAGKNEVVEALFRYATGPEFRHRVETIAHNFIDMKEDLESEKRQTTRRWAKRSKQLDLIIVNTAEMYGELQGLIGNQMEVIPALEGEGAEENQVTGAGLELAAAGDEEGRNGESRSRQHKRQKIWRRNRFGNSSLTTIFVP